MRAHLQVYLTSSHDPAEGQGTSQAINSNCGPLFPEIFHLRRYTQSTVTFWEHKRKYSPLHGIVCTWAGSRRISHAGLCKI